MVQCSILGCNSSSDTKEDATFHCFPSDPPVRSLWIAAVNRQNWNVNKSSRVCSKHFEAHCFRKTEKLTFIRPGSVPKLFLKDKLTKVIAKTENMSQNNITTDDESPLVKKLKEDIYLLRKKTKEDGIKIKCLQNKIRRILRKQGNSKADDTPTTQGLALKRRRSSYSIDDESSDSGEFLAGAGSASEDNLETEVGCKGATELEGELIESVKTEQEDDPLTFYGSNG